MFRRTLTPSTNDDESPMSVRSRNKRDCSFLPSDWSVTTKALSHMTQRTKGLFKGCLKLLFGKLFHSDMHADSKPRKPTKNIVKATLGKNCF